MFKNQKAMYFPSCSWQFPASNFRYHFFECIPYILNLSHFRCSEFSYKQTSTSISNIQKQFRNLRYGGSGQNDCYFRPTPSTPSSQAGIQDCEDRQNHLGLVGCHTVDDNQISGIQLTRLRLVGGPMIFRVFIPNGGWEWDF